MLEIAPNTTMPSRPGTGPDQRTGVPPVRIHGAHFTATHGRQEPLEDPQGLSDLVGSMLRRLPSVHAASMSMPASEAAARSSAAGKGWSASLSGRNRPHCPGIRFVYTPRLDDTGDTAEYHDLLAIAEILLDRVLQARACGAQPIMPSVGPEHKRRVFDRPRPETLGQMTTEYRRWHDVFGHERALPLTREALVQELTRHGGLSASQAAAKVRAESYALPATLQSWIVDRSQADLAQRPLDRDEFNTLCRVLDAISSAGNSSTRNRRHPHSPVIRTNARIAIRSAAILGCMIDTFMPSPFRQAALSDAYASFHAEHLARLSPSLPAHRPSREIVQRWSAARTARVRALAEARRDKEDVLAYTGLVDHAA